MPPRHALDVLIAFRMDVTKLRYENWDEVIHYCRYSAMPVGRFMLDVHGESTSTWAASDALCAGLQINNHLQDCGKDYQRPQSRLSAARCAGARPAPRSRSSGRARRRRALLQCLHALAVRTEALLDESKSLSAEVRDFRLGLEISVIQAFADRIVGLLKVRDPLSERVHLSPIELLAHSLAGIAGEMARRAIGTAARVQTGGRRMTLETAAANANYGTTASGSSFYAAMRILPREQREAMFQIYSFCRQVDDIADSDGPRAERLAALQQWRDDIDALYQGHPPARLRDYVASVQTVRPEARGFSRHRRRHGNGRAAGHPGAGSRHARSLLRPRRQRGRAAVGAGVRSCRGRRHPARASSRPRAAIDQHPARHRRGRRHRPAVSAARRPAACRHHRRPIRQR